MPGQQTAHFQFSNSRIGNRGFGLVGLMIFLPLALTLIVGLAVMAMTVKETARGDSLCEKHAMTLEDNLSKPLEALLKLNPKARELRVRLGRLKKEETAAIASGNEEALAVIQPQIAATKFAQLVLDRDQRALIKVSNSQILQDAEKWRQALSGMNPIINAPKIQVQPLPPGEIAPEYTPVANFSAEQAASARFRMTSAQMLGPRISALQSRFGKKESAAYNEACAATLEPNGRNFSARLWWSHP